jgi:hypothetical protein
MSDSGLPRLAYVADVNVQNYCHGSLQLFRLLSGYPPEKLRIIETTWNCSAPERRLPGVAYQHHRPRWTRLLHQSRFPGLAPFLAKLAQRRWREMGRLMEDFQPEALLTVAHGFSWLAVSELSCRKNLPLHLIIHDDWVRHPTFSSSVSLQLDAVFQEHYRSAASRLCVSAVMEESYRKSYGIAGTVLYPTRSTDLAVAAEPPSRLGQELSQLTVAFAGTLHPGQIAPMRTMVEVLANTKGRLLIFGPMTQAELDHAGLCGPQVEFRGMHSPNDLIAAVRREADLLYAPISFDEQWRGNASMGFPSKLTDYSAAALPMLIHGPSWASAVQWGLQEADCAIVLQDPASEPLEAALLKIQRDPQLRFRLAQGAVLAGQKYFSADAAALIFGRSLSEAEAPTLSS